MKGKGRGMADKLKRLGEKVRELFSSKEYSESMTLVDAIGLYIFNGICLECHDGQVRYIRAEK